MADHGGETNEINEKPLNLLTIPQELRDQILKEALQIDAPVLLDNQDEQQQKYDGIGKESQDVKAIYCSLALTCKQLHKESIPIFFQNNTFEVWAYGMDLARSNRCCRLIRNFDIHVVFVIGSLVSHLIALVKVRGTTVTMTVDDKTWSVLRNGTEEVRGTSKHEHHANHMFFRLQPSLKMLHETVRGGDAMGIETLKEIQRKMDRAS